MRRRLLPEARLGGADAGALDLDAAGAGDGAMQILLTDTLEHSARQGAEAGVSHDADFHETRPGSGAHGHALRAGP
ncbi:MAG: hypothetical protein OXC59_00390 [Acidimicrobiaceae bacterium]|nr:hypothetical protein [Acidimicrobiaceae bacterium]